MTISQLIEGFSKNRQNYLLPTYNETQLRNDFLDPFFEILGWDINNSSRRTTNEREVILEESLKAGYAENAKKPDYTFRLFSQRKFFAEAKKPSVQIQNNHAAAKQVRRYGFTAKLKVSVVSNFEYLMIYDCSLPVDEQDTYNRGLIKKYHYTEYEEKFDEIKEFLGKESVYSGNFDEVWREIEDRINKFSVDDLFLAQINKWRLMLGKEIFKYSSEIDEEKLNDVVQSYLNSILFLRVCEDRELEQYQTLFKFANDEDFDTLMKKFVEADNKYNSGLFNNNLPQEILGNVSSVFWKIIRQLYFPETPYSFAVFSSDVLGNIYEIFLSEKLAIKDGDILLEKKPEHVDRDVVTTPIFIITDILKQVLTPYCRGKSDDQILSIKIADISCGSGAFLLETYQLLNDTLIDFYLQNDPDKLIRTSVNSYKLPFDLKKKLLLNCIYGVDKDFTAVEATKFGLLLKLLESENQNTIGKKSVLPLLTENIYFGNSLIEPRYLISLDSSEKHKVNPFVFPQQFDFIIGNPPYMKSEDMKEITPLEYPVYKANYTSAFKQFDKYFLFIERGLSLLKDNGHLGYIVPSKFTKVGAGKNLRQLLSQSQSLAKIVSFGANQLFKSKTTYTCLLFLSKNANQNFDFYEVNNLTNWKVRGVKNEDYESNRSDSLDSDTWVLVPKYLQKVYKRIKDESIELGDLIGEENIFNGIQTSANNIYIFEKSDEDEKYFHFKKNGTNWKIEKDLTRPYFKTSSGDDNLYTYRPLQPNSHVIYPYKKVEGSIEFIEIEELKEKYPSAYKYLMAYKEELSSSTRDIKPEPTTSNEWYRFGRHQSLDKCDVPAKIVVGVLSSGDKYAIDTSQTLITSGGTAGYCMIVLPTGSPYSIYYIQALLNSKYLEWFSSLIGEVFRGGYIARGTKVLKKLPIRVINFDQRNEKDLHDKIVELQKKLIEIQVTIDQNQGNERNLIQLRRDFSSAKNDLDETLKTLFGLEDEDNLVPLIKDLYATH